MKVNLTHGSPAATGISELRRTQRPSRNTGSRAVVDSPALLFMVAVLAVTASALPASAQQIVADPPASKEIPLVKDKPVSLPKAVAGVIAGLTIGVPVKIGQEVSRETRRIAATLRNDVGNDFGIMSNVFVIGGAVPFGILGGTILGTISGTEHALTYGSHQPFSRESLSLKPPAQEPDKL